MFVQRPACFKTGSVRQGSPKQKALAHAANTAGRVNAAFGVLGHGVFAAVAKKEWPVFAHLALMKDGASRGASTKFNNGV